MLNIGDIIEIRGKQAIVCFHTSYNDNNYICVFFEEEKIYDIYKYKIENEKLKVLRPQDKEETTIVLNIFLEEAINEYGIPENLNPIIDYLERKLKENHDEEQSEWFSFYLNNIKNNYIILLINKIITF